jgi:cytosine/adenosine deaminase-related metal-dependent hydrolase
MGLKYRPLDMHLSTKLTAVASLDAGITSIIDACHLSISPEHTDAALDALDEAGIRALHMVGALRRVVPLRRGDPPARGNAWVKRSGLPT